jgi:hypothetical protein
MKQWWVSNLDLNSLSNSSVHQLEASCMFATQGVRRARMNSFRRRCSALLTLALKSGIEKLLLHFPDYALPLEMCAGEKNVLNSGLLGSEDPARKVGKLVRNQRRDCIAYVPVHI